MFCAMRGNLITFGLIAALVGIWFAIDHASGSWDRQVKQIWADEEAVIRAKALVPRPAPMPMPPLKAGERDA